MCTKFTIERKRVITAPLTYVAYSTRIIIRINVHLEHIVECFSFFFAKKMYRFVEESERAKCEADDGENDGALICLFRFSTIGRSVCAFCCAWKEMRREIKTHLSFIISHSQIRTVFGNEGF